ncbi:MAG: thioredoxin family protein [Saprospiraceae bacterium]|nr:thioredoxin family protein [Saprospiraceae bacterium]
MKKMIYFSGLFLVSVLAMSMSLLPGTAYQVGDVVADFELKGVDDKMISLSDYMGDGGLILVFTCNTCPYAQLYEDRLIELHQTFAERGFPVLAVNPNDPISKPGDGFAQMKQRATEKEFPFPYLFDADQIVFPKFGATRTPEVFLLDANRVLRYTGAIDDNPKDAASVQKAYVREAIEAIQNGNSPEPTKTKAIGCGIKVKKA